VKILHIWLLATVAVISALAVPMMAQNTDTPEEQPGNIVGTAVDVNNDTVSGAAVVLEGPLPQ
jgi:hypothetical protein